jgi:hypothetical protein
MRDKNLPLDYVSSLILIIFLIVYMKFLFHAYAYTYTHSSVNHFLLLLYIYSLLSLITPGRTLLIILVSVSFCVGCILLDKITIM